MRQNKLIIVIPAFNEEAVLQSTLDRLFQIEQTMIAQAQVAEDSGIMVVDDGSSDRTWAIVEANAAANPRISGVRFSRNFGHQNALIAGLQSSLAIADLTITIDADLQDNPDAIPEMVAAYHQGDDIVYGVRSSRKKDSWFKRNSAEAYYSLLRRLGVDLVPDHADFRLMSHRAVATFLEYQERNIFIRGLIPKLGYSTGKVYYERTPRIAGESKYPLRKMLSFAWDGITSLTVAPVRAVLLLGTVISVFAIIMFIYTLIRHAVGATVSGWASLIISIWFLGGLQLFCLGLIGEYVGKMMVEVKHRPRYTIEQMLNVAREVKE